jgi:hypothetical protein
VINIAFGVAFSQMRVRVRISTPSAFPDVYDKTAEINELTVLQLQFVDIRCIVSDHPWQKEYGLTSLVSSNRPCAELDVSK